MLKKSLIAIIMLTIIVSVSYAQDYTTGTLDNNIILEDLDGKTYDMHSELDKGKHILIFATFIT